MNSISMILPTYNEKGNITKLIDTLVKLFTEKMNIDYEIIVVDDNSPDGTGEIVVEKYKGNNRIKCFIRNKERGLATAIRYGIEKSKNDIIGVMDTDFNHDPKTLKIMIEFNKYYDLIIGSRYVNAGGMENKFRETGSFFYNFLIRLLLHTRIQDNLSGFFTIKREKLFKLNFDKIFFGYGDFFYRMLYYSTVKNFKILEIPVFYKNRTEGESKTNLSKIFIKYTWELLKFYFNK